MNATGDIRGLLASSRATIVADGIRLSASEVLERAETFGASLLDQGIQPGDRVALQLPNGLDAVVSLLGAACVAVCTVAVNTRYSTAEADDLIARSGARRVSPPSEMSGTGRAAGATDLIDAPFVVFTTSGTTSKPKMVLHHQRSIVEHAHDVVSRFGLSPEDVVLIALPMCGTFGLTSLMGALAADATVIVEPFDAEATATTIEQERVTCMNGSDDMFHRLLETGRDLSSVRLGGYARFNSSLTDLVERGDQAGMTLTGLYGMSEIQALFSLRDPAAPASERCRPGGTLTSPDAAYRIVDGELQVRGPSLFAGYLAEGGDINDAELTGRHFDDGWFRTGDLASADDDRTFHYESRLGDVLRLGGFLVAPEEIIEVITSLPGIREAQVVAVERPAGTRPVAFVITEDGTEAEPEPIIAACRDQLARFKVPIAVITVPAFPVTDGPNGVKIRLTELRDLAAATLAET
ncbi:MAG: AMP-binding protein [Ilumatobacteraceae bacterium]